MQEFRVTIDIEAPAARVWQVMSDVERWHEWTPSITSVRLAGGSLAIGRTAWIRQPKLPPARWKVTAIEPGRSFTWVSIAPGIRVVAEHAVETAGDASVATLSVDYQGALGGLLARLVGGITERYIGFEARGLKARSEEPVPDGPADAARRARAFTVDGEV